MSNWNEVIRLHALLLQRMYPPEKIKLVSEESGITISPDGSNSANSYGDLKKYVDAIGIACGPIAKVSGKIHIEKSMRALGLRRTQESENAKPS